jgi:alcohol dehydrogenase, propanol-preferring
MRAALLPELPAHSLTVADHPDPLPAEDELLVAVTCCGICGTDLHILAGGSYRPRLPFVLGHEPVGTVVSAGSAAGEAWVGRRVAITIFTGCGQCEQCRRGDERLCQQRSRATGVLERWGGFAERMVISMSQAVDVPAGLPATEAASLVDAGATAANAARILPVVDGRPGMTVVAGGGPVGWLVAEVLRLDGHDVVVAEPLPERRAAVAELGYGVTKALDEVRGRVSVVLDCAGAEGIVPWALERLDPRGVLVVVGYRTVRDADFSLIARKELTVRGVRSGSRRDLVRVLDLASSRRIRLPPVTTWPLEKINDAFAALRRGEVAGKAVITVGHVQPAERREGNQ